MARFESDVVLAVGDHQSGIIANAVTDPPEKVAGGKVVDGAVTVDEQGDARGLFLGLGGDDGTAALAANHESLALKLFDRTVSDVAVHAQLAGEGVTGG